MKELAGLENKVKAIVIAHRKLGDVVMEIENGVYYVEGQKDRKYTVKIVDRQCDCPSWVYRTGVDKDGNCKHIRVVEWMINSGDVIRSVHEVMAEEMGVSYSPKSIVEMNME